MNLKTILNKSFLPTVFLGVACVSSAQAATITIGGMASGTSGYTTSYSNATVINFDNGVLPSNFSITGPGGIATGSSASGSAPANDSTPFLTTGAGSIMMTFATPMDYVGFYWGSVDSYNSVAFTESNGTVETFTGSSLVPLGVGIHGGHSAYVNFLADSGVEWNSVKLSSTQNAFEIDNFATADLASSPVPEPASVATAGVGIGFALLGIASRRRKAKASVR